jgi:molybdopterin-containing oxidoreductase family membrane subunit
MTRTTHEPAVGPPACDPPPVIDASLTYASVNEAIGGIALRRRVGRRWYLGVALGFVLTGVLLFALTWLLIRGIGIWGVNIPVAWGFAITNFVCWIGIGHAGTFISAFLLLMHQDWRTSINRFAEAMTLFAVMCAGIFPLFHMGRPWLFYFLLPYPDTMGLWPQWRSPLVWDVFAVTTYLLVSLLFWYVGLIPDAATMRDMASARWARKAYGVLALGWRGSARHWARLERAYLLLAGLATPLVISVHSVVSLDFAAGIVPGWHSTIFPPYFVAGAIFSGFAMVLTLAIPLRRFYGLGSLITTRHLNNMAKMMLVTGLIVAYSYAMETFMSWYSQDRYEMFMTLDRMVGPEWPVYWTVLLCNVLTPQLLWSSYVRMSAGWLLFIALAVNLGMWLERFMIVVQSLQRDFMPSAWGTYRPTVWDVGTLLGTIGLFVLAFLMFVRLLPAVSMSEARELVHRAHRAGGDS